MEDSDPSLEAFSFERTLLGASGFKMYTYTNIYYIYIYIYTYLGPIRPFFILFFCHTPVTDRKHGHTEFYGFFSTTCRKKQGFHMDDLRK